MRILLLLFIAVFFWATIFTSVAQEFRHPIWPDNEPPKTLISNNSQILPFGTLSVNYSNNINQSWVFFGAQAGIVINNYFILAISGQGLISNNTFFGIEASKNEELQVYGGYSGIVLGGRIAPEKLIHVNIPVLFGIGNLELSDQDFYGPDSGYSYTVTKSLFFMVEPRLEAEINILSKLRLALSAGYRLPSGLDLTTLTSSEFSGMTYQFQIRFGKD